MSVETLAELNKDMSYDEVMSQVNALSQKAAQIRKTQTSTAIAAVKEVITKFSLSKKDIGFNDDASALKKKKQVPVKYRGTNGESWSGRGKTPIWLRKAIAEGKKITDFAV